MRDADGQFDSEEAEAVAEAGVLRLAQVDRDDRPDLKTFRPVALVREIAAHRAGDAGQEEVVDRASERMGDRLDLGQLQGFAPRHALRAARLALEAGRAVARHGEQIGEFARHARAVAQVVRDPQRMTHKVESASQNRGRGFDAGADRRDDRRRERLQPPFLLAGRRLARVLVRGAVDDGHGDPGQRMAVRHRVMQAKHHGGPVLVAFDEMHGPQRVVGVERL